MLRAQAPFAPEPAAGRASAPRRLRATVQYDGTDYLGFQRQAAGLTVQAVLETALATITPEPRVVAAGRTDRGVHAVGQVVHFTYAGAVPVHRLTAVLNGRLPPDVAVADCQEVAPSFHARSSALSRRYQYRFFRGNVREPLRERYSWRLDGELDLPAMQVAARTLVGTRSFRHFGSIPGSQEQQRRAQAGRAWRRTVLASNLEVGDAALYFAIEADAFLTHMVRALTGTLVAIGRRRLALGSLEEALADEQSDTALAPLAPPHGLCLVRVRYPGDDGEWASNRRREEQ